MRELFGRPLSSIAYSSVNGGVDLDAFETPIEETAASNREVNFADRISVRLKTSAAEERRGQITGQNPAAMR